MVSLNRNIRQVKKNSKGLSSDKAASGIAQDLTMKIVTKYGLNKTCMIKIRSVLLSYTYISNRIDSNLSSLFDMLDNYGISNEEIIKLVNNNPDMMFASSLAIKNNLVVLHELGLVRETISTCPDLLMFVKNPKFIYSSVSLLNKFVNKVNVKDILRGYFALEDEYKEKLYKVFPLSEKQYFIMKYNYEMYLKKGNERKREK